ncbi:hypothetical protein [Amycolatopsis sp. NPDC102389]|uniref:hypothetical protein n=1 Tax=Amycolatopsis sp. NPDC102389 TaxID=3363941 RepID=UPI003807A1A0
MIRTLPGGSGSGGWAASLIESRGDGAHGAADGLEVFGRDHVLYERYDVHFVDAPEWDT